MPGSRADHASLRHSFTSRVPRAIQRNAAVRVIAQRRRGRGMVRHEFRRHIDRHTATMMVQDTDYRPREGLAAAAHPETFATVAALEEED